MNEARPPKIKPHHLERLAVVYIRQSTPRQVEGHQGSTAHQRGQDEHPRRWGWPESAIVVITDDLGLSGTSGEHREGWKRLLRMVAQQRVGIIVVSDPTRLSRSTADAEALLELCEATDTLLAIEGVVHDLGIPADALALRIRFNVGVFDNKDRAHRLMQAKRALAGRGHAVTLRPTGYIVVEKGRWAKDPNAQVQQSIGEVFRLYRRLGTVGKVLKVFRDNDLKFPIRPAPQDRNPAQDPKWVRPTRTRIYNILVNPAFAGYYAYGRRPHLRGAPRGRDVRRRTSWPEWIVVPNHHEPYIPPAEWHAIYERLRQNRVTVRQPAGTGPALVQGILRCGRCGRRMNTQYYPIPSGGKGITYSCAQANIQYGDPKCWSVNGRSLDALVAAELLRCLEPPEVDAVLAAAGEVNQGYEAARRERGAELARADYAARRAEERYKAVDPRNRLVAATLEQEWEQAKESLRQLERRHQEEPLKPPLEVTPEVLEAIRRLAVDLPALWAGPSTTNEDRKALVRLFVGEIRVLSIAKTGCDVEIAWVGGAVSRHSVVHPWAGGAVIRELAAQGWDPAQIAEELNRRGFSTYERKQPYTAAAVRLVLRSAALRARLAAQRRVRAGAPREKGDGDETP